MIDWSKGMSRVGFGATCVGAGFLLACVVTAVLRCW